MAGFTSFDDVLASRPQEVRDRIDAIRAYRRTQPQGICCPPPTAKSWALREARQELAVDCIGWYLLAHSLGLVGMLLELPREDRRQFAVLLGADPEECPIALS